MNPVQYLANCFMLFTNCNAQASDLNGFKNALFNVFHIKTGNECLSFVTRKFYAFAVFWLMSYDDEAFKFLMMLEVLSEL